MTTLDFPKIVIVHDQPLVRLSLAQALRRANPLWEVVEARSPREALDRVLHDRIAVVIADQDLAGTSGFDLLGEARGLSPATVGVILLGRVDAHSIADSINLAGAFRCLPKPYDTSTLLGDLGEAIIEHRRRYAVQEIADRLAVAAPPVRPDDPTLRLLFGSPHLT